VASLQSPNDLPPFSHRTLFLSGLLHAYMVGALAVLQVAYKRVHYAWLLGMDIMAAEWTDTQGHWKARRLGFRLLEVG
jgi:hypothetical protein